MLGIIIPYYSIRFFDKTLESLAVQTDKRFKVYIGNDASPDDPSMLLETYNGQFSYTYHNFEQNIGRHNLVGQWERCIALSADEPWLMILGDDDVLSPDCVSEFYRHLDTILQQGIAVVRYSSYVIDGNDKRVSEVFTHPILEQATTAYYKRFKEVTRSSLSEYIFSRKVYEAIGFYPFPLGWHSDDRAWLEFSKGQNLYSLNAAIVKVRLSDYNISGQSDNYQQKYEASYQFFGWLLNSACFKEFGSEAQLELVASFEALIRKRNRYPLRNWLLLLRFYILKGMFAQAYQAYRNYLKKLLK